jgi:DNA polymerase IIIc chi subunit
MINASIKVTFLNYPTPQEKIKKLLSIVQTYYKEKKFLYILTENPAITDYVDKLLWEHPKDSFLPHTTQLGTSSWICINSSLIFPETTYAFFNLTSNPINPPHTTCKIYELEESKSGEKKKIFEKKYKFYQDAGYHLISL